VVSRLPMRLKLHHLTNLHDARASAAWGAHYLGFALERGHLYKLSESAVEAFFEWLSGSFLVMQLGEDLAQAAPLTPWLRQHRLWLEFDGPTAAEAFARGTLELPVPYGLTCPLGVASSLPTELVAQAQYLDVLPGPALDTAALTQLRASLPQGLPLLLRTDALAATDLPAAAAHADGLSLGAHQPDAFGQLDYDRVEALLDVLGELD
ncbi:MAG: hypothetical protein SFY70_03790, partial [Bacteroidia bacterium]|nr:hypothetical protein [Bacteroidia bacterium]